MGANGLTQNPSNVNNVGPNVLMTSANGGAINNNNNTNTNNNNLAQQPQSQQMLGGTDDLRYHGTELVMLYDYKVNFEIHFQMIEIHASLVS